MTAFTPKQARVAEEYLIDLNATQAAIRAGYSAKTTQPQTAMSKRRRPTTFSSEATLTQMPRGGP
jgi:hypothetical protein